MTRVLQRVGRIRGQARSRTKKETGAKGRIESGGLDSHRDSEEGGWISFRLYRFYAIDIRKNRG